MAPGRGLAFLLSAVGLDSLPLADSRTSALNAGNAATSYTINVTNKYTEKLGKIGAEYPWNRDSVIVDAHRTFLASVNCRDAVFSISAANGTRLAESQAASATASGRRKSRVEASTFRESSWQFPGLGDNRSLEGLPVGTYTLSAACPASVLGAAAAVATRTLHALRVRRELRQLDDEDAARFVNALKTMYALPTAEGQLRYGPDYVGQDDILQWHYNGAYQMDADHLHQGMGFVMQHAKFNLLMEDVFDTVRSPASSPSHADYVPLTPHAHT